MVNTLRRLCQKPARPDAYPPLKGSRGATVCDKFCLPARLSGDTLSYCVAVVSPISIQRDLGHDRRRLRHGVQAHANGAHGGAATAAAKVAGVDAADRRGGAKEEEASTQPGRQRRAWVGTRPPKKTVRRAQLAVVDRQRTTEEEAGHVRHGSEGRGGVRVRQVLATGALGVGLGAKDLERQPPGWRQGNVRCRLSEHVLGSTAHEEVADHRRETQADRRARGHLGQLRELPRERRG